MLVSKSHCAHHCNHILTFAVWHQRTNSAALIVCVGMKQLKCSGARCTPQLGEDANAEAVVIKVLDYMI